MIKLLFLRFVFICYPTQDENIPFKNDKYFNFELDYNFKKKEPPPSTEVNWNDQRKNYADLLPYVKVNLKIPKPSPEDYRVKVITNRGAVVYNKKVKGPFDIPLDMGFSEDIKDRINPHIYNVYFIDQEKNIHSRIEIIISKKGELYVNEKLFGNL